LLDCLDKSRYSRRVMHAALQAEIDRAIAADKPIKIRAYAILPVTEEGMNYIAENVLLKYNREDLLAPVYTAVKELAINGAKANIKKILFQEKRISMDDEEEYEQGMKMFRDQLSEDWIFDYAFRARKEDLYVDILYDFNPHRLIIEVVNNRAITEREDSRIRQKFQKAMQYDDIAQFYMDGGDESEGAGMGIVLVTMLLRAQGVDPHLFTIRSNYVDSTVAKIEFPISKHYRTSRERFAKADLSPVIS